MSLRVKRENIQTERQRCHSAVAVRLPSAIVVRWTLAVG